MTTYYLTSLPGLAGVLAGELHEQLGHGVREQGVVRLRNAEITTVQYAGDPGDLRGLRTVEDVFVSVGRFKLTGRISDTKALAAAALWGGPLREVLAVWSQATGRPLVKRLTWRVVVQADDVAWRQYRRLELVMAAERGLLNAGTSWRINRDEAPLELWLQQVGHELLVSVRLTTGLDRQHGGRTAERAAALRPSVAAALVRLSRPANDDVFLDPMCGTGTILLERAVAGRYQLLIGGDHDPAAVAATEANFGPRHQPREFHQWDARRLPLADGWVTRLVTNLPWGRQIGEKAAMPALYAELVPEFSRVVAPGGRLVLLTSEWEALKAAVAARSELWLEQTVRDVEVLGRRADVFVLERA